MTVQRVPGGSRGRSVPPFLRRLISLVGRLAYRLGANRSKTLLLTTIGARSGREHTSPVGYFPDGADAWLVVASMGGDRRHPAWYHNLVANPNRASVQVAGRRVPVSATSLHGPERAERWERIVATAPNFGEYQRATDREIPVLRLEAAGQRGLDLRNQRARVVAKGGAVEWIHWQSGAAQLLPRLLRGREAGPVFLAERRAPARTATLDVCPITGRARLSYRRAAELFTDATRRLERGGAGWTLHQLRHSDLTHEAEAGASTPMLRARGASTSRWRPQCLSVTILGSITKIVAYRRSFPQW